MTEAEWLACKNPTTMLRFLHLQNQRTGGWRHRLFGWLDSNAVAVSERRIAKLLVAFYRHHPRLFAAERDRRALEVAESFIYGKATSQELVAANSACMAYEGGYGYPSPGYWLTDACRQPYYKMGEDCYVEYVLGLLSTAASFENLDDFIYSYEPVVRDRLEMEYYFASESERMVTLLHETIGNPFRPVTLNPIWISPIVLALATGIDKEGTFDRMPILADALQDAGCDNDDILNHCRQPSGHVRGCWALDLLLGKS